MTLLISYYRELQTYDKINTIKKYIVHDQNDTFYVVAWISEENLKKIERILIKFDDIDYIVEDGINPPTKLKNNKIIKPFEALVKMYGMPKINELDPTWFVAISTFMMFGFMFGDVGHGLIFLIVGLALMLKKKSYGAILFAGGLSSTIFGVLYGSVFGKEDIIKSVLISPMNDINTMLVYGIAVGTVFILIAMILNIVNGIKNKDFKRIFLDENGIAGIALYTFVLICVAYYFLKGKMIVSINVIVIACLILVLIIMFNDKITNLLEKKKEKASTPFVEKVFEIIEMLLAFLSNTISFLRLAAFAINHAGLCMAVYLLADMTTGAGNVLIAVIGNVVVLVLEGLIVGIQTLRLEYYELFSRFYDGSGKEYKSIKNQIEEV
jgi:V/A-type H+-transporting ATPase subunit I